MRLITQSPHDESTPTAITFRGGGSLVVKTNRPKKKPKETCIYDVHSMLGFTNLGALHKGRPHREGGRGCPKADMVREVAWT